MQQTIMGWIYKKTLNRTPKEELKANFTSNQPVEKPQFKWEKGVKEDVARLCHKWKLTAQNGTVWRQKLQET
jgi:hypothetical protein